MSTVWQQRPEVGNTLMLRFGLRVALGAGRGVTRALLRVSAAYLLLRRAPERRASQDYLRRVLGRRARLTEVYRHLLCFAQVVLDRVYLVSERFRRFEIRCSGLAELDATLAQGRGVLLFGAHLGSFEALRVLSQQRPEVPVRILLDQQQGPGISAALNSLNPALAQTIIDTRVAGPTLALAIRRELEGNAIVALLADRAVPGEDMREVQFLDGSAPLPVGPWLLAAALQVPVVLAFGLYRGGSRYDLHFELFAQQVDIARRTDAATRAATIAAVLQRFADRMAHYARLAPYNWFNFYAFWNDAGVAPRADAGAVCHAGAGSRRA
jgi:predicted LPLAT superfamily acyltransferase